MDDHVSKVIGQKPPQAHHLEQENLVTVVLPLMGEGITEATFVKSLKKIGDHVGLDDPLFEVSTDKVDTEIPSPAEGILVQVIPKDGQTVAVSSPVMMLKSSVGETPKTSPEISTAFKDHERSAPKSPSSSLPIPSQLSAGSLPQTDVAFTSTELSPITPPDSRSPEHGEAPRVSPLVRKIARERNIDLSQVTGTGLGGRLTLKDLDRIPVQKDLTFSTNHMATVDQPLQTKILGGVETLDGVPVRREKMSKMRGLIAEHMVRSVKTSPHVTTIFEIDMHRVASLKSQWAEPLRKSQDVNLTYTAFFAYAAAKAIKKFPIMNVSVDRGEILWKDAINLGIAVALESGLIVPVVRQAQDLNLIGIARQIQLLAQKARTKKLSPEDVQGGTFSITNPGMFGSLVSTPIINQPQVAILSIGAVIKRPVVLTLPLDNGSDSKKLILQDTIAIRPMVQVGITFDHRVVDGEGGARFLAFYKEILETFSQSEITI